MRFIGDVHTKIQEYLKIIESTDESIQVGDFGIGFREEIVLSKGHRAIRGNHDNPILCESLDYIIPDFSYLNNIFFVGGASSWDRRSRVEGIDWWPEEERTIQELNKGIETYNCIDPEIVVSHDCPDFIARDFFKATDTSRTRQALNAMYEINQPALWVFGHWHRHLDVKIGRTRFIGLDKLEYRDIEL